MDRAYEGAGAVGEAQYHHEFIPGMDLRRYRMSDAGNAELLVALYGEALRYDHREGVWYVWVAPHWQRDDRGMVQRLAVAAARWREGQLDGLDADQLGRRARAAQAAWALRSENSGRVGAALRVAATERALALRGDEWDRDPWLLGVSNGVVDLRTGELRATVPGDLTRLHSKVAYDPEAECPRWQQFLEEVFGGNEEMAGFVARAVGYTLTGVRDEDVWFLLQGNGCNGKRTFVRTLREVLGGYALDVAFRRVLRGWWGLGQGVVGLLEGRRLVTVVGAPEGRIVSAPALDALGRDREHWLRTGGRRAVSVHPVAKLWMAVDGHARLGDSGGGVLGRCRVIPFEQAFEGDRADRGLAEQLRGEAAGILRWAVEGCRAWQEQGLGVPSSVSEATGAWCEDEDPYGSFLATVSAREPGRFVTTDEMYEAYDLWCFDMEIEGRPKKIAFGRAMSERLENGRHPETRKRGYKNVKLIKEWYWRVHRWDPLDPDFDPAELDRYE